jgi:hypothetical protein
MEESKTSEEMCKSLKYTLEELLSYLEYQNLCEDQVMFIYFSVNGDEEKAKYYKKLCDEKIKKDNERYSILKTEEEIKKMSPIEEQKNMSPSDEEDEKPVKIKKQKNIKL